MNLCIGPQDVVVCADISKTQVVHPADTGPGDSWVTQWGSIMRFPETQREGRSVVARDTKEERE